jgi:ATPase family associated with various cellular activities (AAA)
MDHLLEILKIVEGAMNADRPKVQAYVDQLAGKLESDGERKAADRLRRAAYGGRMARMDVSEVAAKRLPVDQESRLPLADEEHLQQGHVPLVLDAYAEITVQEFLQSVRGTDKLIAQGIDFVPSLLAFGPPGCGKTQLARYLAAELELPLVTARADSLISSFLGSTSKNLRTLFDHAVSRPCVLFLDEFDAVAKLRDDRYELGELKRVVVSLLQNIDALSPHTVLVAATNHEHLLDPAIWRRFSYHVRMAAPSEDARKGLFREFLQGYTPDDLAHTFARVSEGFTGAEIRRVCEAAKREAVIGGRKVIEPGPVFLRIIHGHRAKAESQPHTLASDLKLARSINPDVFTYRCLAEMYGVSLGQISKILKH